MCVFACTFVFVSPDPKRSSANRMFTSQECTFSDKHTFTHQSLLSRRNLVLSHSLAYIHQLSHTHDHISLTHTHTHSIKCDWVGKPLNESGWLGPQRGGLTFPFISSPSCACVFLWVSGCKLSGPHHFTSNVTDLNEMAKQTVGWKREAKNRNNLKKKGERKRVLSQINLLSWLSPFLHKKQQSWDFKIPCWLWKYRAGPCGYTNLPLLLSRWLSLHFHVLRAQTDREADRWVRPLRSKWAGGNWGFVCGFDELLNAEG